RQPRVAEGPGGRLLAVRPDPGQAPAPEQHAAPPREGGSATRGRGHGLAHADAVDAGVVARAERPVVARDDRERVRARAEGVAVVVGALVSVAGTRAPRGLVAAAAGATIAVQRVAVVALLGAADDPVAAAGGDAVGLAAVARDAVAVVAALARGEDAVTAAEAEDGDVVVPGAGGVEVVALG